MATAVTSPLATSLVRRRRSDRRPRITRAPPRAAGDKIGGDYGLFTVDEEVKHDGNIYVIRESLGQGSFGTTYRATTNDGDDIALKVLSFRNMKNWKALELFEREARTLKGLNHPAIPQYVDNFELDTDGDRFFCLAQRIAPGRSLQSLVDGGWRPTEPEVVAIAEQLLEVLGYLSSLRPPVCHRDVKPGNVLLDVETGRVSLVDFGATADAAVTTAMAAEGTTGGGYAQGGSTVVGTFGYCAPELYMGAVTPRSDLYSVGATALFLLSGRAPSTMPSTRLRVDFRGVVQIESARLEATVGRLLEPSPEDRFESPGEAVDFLRGGGVYANAKTGERGERRNRGGSKGAMGGRMFTDRRDRARDRGGGDDGSGPGGEMDFDETVAGLYGPIVDGAGIDWGSTAAEAAAARAVNAPSSLAPRRRIRRPAGTRVICERTGRSKLLLVVPPRGLTPGATYIAGFAVAWNSFVAFWTASALASGGGLIFAAFSIPFWLAGKEVATSAFDEIFEASRLEIDAFKFEFTRTATGLVSDGRDGDVQDVSGCRMVVESVNNGEPSVCLELEVGAEPVRFGRGLQRVELEYVCGEVNSFLDDLNATSPLD